MIVIINSSRKYKGTMRTGRQADEHDVLFEYDVYNIKISRCFSNLVYILMMDFYSKK